MTEATGLGASLPVRSLGIDLSLTELYEDVEFPSPPPLKVAAR